MRVLFINRMLSMVRGGGETFDLEIGWHLAKIGVDVQYLTGIPLTGGARVAVEWPHSATQPKRSVIRTPYTGDIPWDRITGGWRLRSWDLDRFQRQAVRWCLKNQNEFDLIQVCELPVFVNLWKSSGSQTPVVMRMPGPQDFVGVGEGAERNVDALIASGTSITYFTERGVACQNVPNGGGVDSFSQGVGNRDSLGLPEDGPVIL